MTIEEILKAQGLTDEQISMVIKSMDKNKLSVVAEGEENLTTRYGKLKTDFENLTAQHGESTKLIKQLKKDNASFSYLICDLQTFSYLFRFSKIIHLFSSNIM